MLPRHLRTSLGFAFRERRAADRNFHSSAVVKMPIKFNNELPAYQTLKSEGVWIAEQLPQSQNIPSLKIGIMNIMPVKIPTETQLLRMLGRSPVHVDVTLFVPTAYAAKGTPPEHLSKFYKRWEEIKNEKFDGFIVTGAPIETLDFEQVSYWKELQGFFDRVVATDAAMLTLCWGAMASLYHFHKVPKYVVNRKQFGVFTHKNLDPTSPLTLGIGPSVGIPVSRHSMWHAADVDAVGPKIKTLLTNDVTGPSLVWDAALAHAHMINHFEYDAGTLDNEYRRDLVKGTPTGDPIHLPHNYYPEDNPDRAPPHSWMSPGQVFYSNWLSTVLRRKYRL